MSQMTKRVLAAPLKKLLLEKPLIRSLILGVVEGKLADMAVGEHDKRFMSGRINRAIFSISYCGMPVWLMSVFLLPKGTPTFCRKINVQTRCCIKKLTPSTHRKGV